MSSGEGDDVARGAAERIRVDDLIGAEVRVVARRGYVIEGVCLAAWSLGTGGAALKIKPSDGSAPREVTTVKPIVVLSPGNGSKSA